MTILIVEDLTEQIKIAKEALSTLGYKVAVARTLADAKQLIGDLKEVLGGVITDVHFPESYRFAKKTAEKPNGLAVVAFCVRNGIPVAICSDIDHHFCAYVRDVIDVLAMHSQYPSYKIPFMTGSKNWDSWYTAGKELEQIIKKQEVEKERKTVELMIVTNNKELADALERALSASVGAVDIVHVDHREALGKFLELTPARVLVGEYDDDDNADDEDWPGHVTWRYLADAALPGQVLRRFGFMKKPAPDFIRLPFTLDDLRKSLEIS